MPTAHSPDGTFPTFPLDLINDGESVQFSSLMKDAAAAKGLIAKLINAVGYASASATNRYKLGSRSLTRPPHLIHSEPSATNRWNPAATTGFQWTSATTSSGTLFMAIRVPNGATLTQIRVWMKGAAGHGALPATMPQILFKTVDIDTDTVTTITSQVDTSASVAAFELVHSITITGISPTINNVTTMYEAQLLSEAGANAVAGAKFCGAEFTFTTTEMDDGAG